MKKRKQPSRVSLAIRWTPRILVALFALFLSIFALDVFSEGYSFWEALLGFLIHLVPTYLILAALAIVWKWERVDGILFITLGLGYIIMGWGQFPFLTYAFITCPTFLTGALFIAGHYLPGEKGTTK